jgi:3-hydroxyisobutyrate dehydrogenase
MAQARLIGLGNMGAGIARNLLAAGIDLAVADTDPARVAGLVALGAEAAGDDVTEELVLLSLPGPAEVESLCLGPAGLLARMAAGSVLVNLSTVGVDTARRLEEAASTRGVLTVDAPVTGAADGAAAGTMTIMVGASDEALARARCVLEPISSRIVHLGRPGDGTAGKLLTNMLWFIHVTALSDALALAVASGLDPARFAELVRISAGGSWVAEHDLGNILADDDDPSFTLALCVKDLRLIAELEADRGYASDLAAAARARFGEAHEQFGPRRGELSVTRLAEERAGVSIRARA